MTGPSPLVVICPTADATRALAARLGSVLAPGSVLVLSGELGAGKTTFTQGLAHGLGIADPVASPTFVLVREYGRRDAGETPILAHMDFYRLGGNAEAFDLGLDDYWARGDIVVIEWPEMAPAAIPADTLRIRLEVRPDLSRRITLASTGPVAAKALADLAAAPAHEQPLARA